MKQLKSIVLTYGKGNKEENSIDVSKPGWFSLIEKDLDDIKIYSNDPTATMIASKFIARNRILPINELNLPGENSSPVEEKESSIKFGEICISNTYNPQVEKSKVWISSYHLKLLEKLQGACKIELLDEYGRIVKPTDHQ